MKTSCSAFTILDIMIVVIIIMLTTAMAIPAYQKIREGAIVKMHDSGATMSYDQQQEYEKIRQSQAAKITKSSDNFSNTPSVSANDYGVMDVNGKKYFMIPADKIQTKIDVNGATYYLIPAK